MNERIRELFTPKLNEWGAENDDNFTEELEKFAELIVLKCAELVAGVPTDTLGYHTADQKIKEHFGVEE